MTFWGLVLVVLVVGIFKLGSLLSPKVVYQEVQKEVVIEISLETPVLDRIAGCESQGNRNSKGTHFDKNGQVLMRSNTNRTVDLGKYQINTVWFSKATELGLDLTKEDDNKKMAEWIYYNRGTGDWSASSKCWK
jgi:hypothetical protein